MRPEVVVHSLVSVDGSIEGFQSPDAIKSYYEVAEHLDCDTWLVGADTILEAEQTFEIEAHALDRTESELPDIAKAKGEGILLVIPDSGGRITNWYTHMHSVGARGVVALISETTPEAYRDNLEKRNVPYIRSGQEKTDLSAALQELYQTYRVRRIKTDSGGKLNNVLLKQGLVDELSLVLSPELTGNAGRRHFRTLEVPDSIQLQLDHMETVNEQYVWLNYRIDQ